MSTQIATRRLLLDLQAVNLDLLTAAVELLPAHRRIPFIDAARILRRELMGCLKCSEGACEVPVDDGHVESEDLATWLLRNRHDAPSTSP